MANILTTHDTLLIDDSEAAAIVARQALEPALGDDAVIFPPTYAPAEREGKSGYNIDDFGDGENFCLIDSIGSQANRIEPLFKNGAMANLIPGVEINAKDGSPVNLLDLGHRAADAIARFTPALNDLLYEAFLQCGQANHEPMARIAPTTIVFGAWDSRATQVKLPRLISSVIRANNVKTLTRSAQYVTVAGNLLNGVDVDRETGPESEVGLTHVPSPKQHGGIIAQGGISRDIQIYLTPLRRLRSGDGSDEAENLRLRRYIFGLCVTALTAKQDYYLREGCQLVAKERIEWTLREFDGGRETFAITHKEALEYAQATAADFGVTPPDIVENPTFDAQAALKMVNSKNRKEEQRKDPSEWQI